MSTHWSILLLNPLKLRRRAAIWLAQQQGCARPHVVQAFLFYCRSDWLCEGRMRCGDDLKSFKTPNSPFGIRDSEAGVSLLPTVYSPRDRSA